MKLSRAQVMQIAELAKLSLTDTELDNYAEQLSAVLEYASKLEQLDTSNIPPTASVLPLNSVMREDEVRPSLPRQVALASAPQVVDGQFRVEPILDEA